MKPLLREHHPTTIMFSLTNESPLEAILFDHEGASMISALRSLLQDNCAKGIYERNGKRWVAIPIRELATMWPHWSEAQIEYHLRKLRAKGVLLTETNNKFKTDRTLSYTFADDKLIKGYKTLADVDTGILSACMSSKIEKKLARCGLKLEAKTDVSVSESSQEEVGNLSSLNGENTEMEKRQSSTVIQENAQKDIAQSFRVIRENVQKDVVKFRDVKSSNSHITFEKIATSLKRREDTNTQVFVSSSPQKERSASPCQAEAEGDNHHSAVYPHPALHDLPDFVLLWDKFVRLYNEHGRANGAYMDAGTAEDFTAMLCELADPVGVLNEALRLGCTDLRMVADRVEKQASLTTIARQAYKSGQAPGFTQDAAANRILASALAADPKEWPTRMQWEITQQPVAGRLAIEYLQSLFEEKAQALTALYNGLVQANRISEPCIGGGQ